MKAKLSTYDLIRQQQRTDDLRRLREFKAQLPTGHHELPGVIRAIGVLSSLPLVEPTS